MNNRLSGPYNPSPNNNYEIDGLPHPTPDLLPRGPQHDLIRQAVQCAQLVILPVQTPCRMMRVAFLQR